MIIDYTINTYFIKKNTIIGMYTFTYYIFIILRLNKNNRKYFYYMVFTVGNVEYETSFVVQGTD